jgi:hypothetical protein
MQVVLSGIKVSFIKSDVSIYCFFDCITEQTCAIAGIMDDMQSNAPANLAR